MGLVSPEICCSYGPNLDNALGFECIDIPGAAKSSDPDMFLPNNRFCGRSAGLVSVDMATKDNAKTICSSMTPFLIRFTSDAFETSDEAMYEEGKQTGFQLQYMQKGCSRDPKR